MWEYETLQEFEGLSEQEKLDKIIKMLEQARNDKIIFMREKKSKTNRSDSVEADVINYYYYRDNLCGVKDEDTYTEEERLAVFCVIDKKCGEVREQNYAFVDNSLYIDKIQTEESRIILNYTLGEKADMINVFGDDYGLFLHQFVFYPNYRPTVDHISHNRRINIKSMLRVCKIAENNANRKGVKKSKRLDEETYEKFKYKEEEDFSETWYAVVYWKVIGTINKKDVERYQEEYLARKKHSNITREKK